MYQGQKRRLGAGPMSMEGMVQTAKPAQHAQFANDPSAMDMAKQLAVSKGTEAGMNKTMEYGAPLAKDALAAMKAPFMNSTAATSAMNAGVDAGIANAMAGAAPTASGTMAAGTAGAGAMAGLGAAMPWIGAGLLGAKMFGLFSEGGLVGPLAGIKYKSMGGEVSDEFDVKFVSPLNPK